VRRNHQWLRATALVLGTAATIAAGCGIPTDRQAQSVDNPPEELFEPLPTTTSTTAPNQEVIYRLRLYWHTDGGVLVVRERIYGVSPTLSEALNELAAGPREGERAEDPSTFYDQKFPAAINPQQADVVDGIAYISVADEPDFRGLPNRRLAAAEIVCTTIQFDLVNAVIIEDSLGVINVTDINANPIEGPADASQFDGCEPPLSSSLVTEGPTESDGE
jgi:hypothetical protein